MLQNSVEVTYYVRSSVLGAVIAEVNAQGQRQKGYVYAGGQMLVKQWGNYLYWQHENPVTGSTRSEATAGDLYADEESGELDPLGNDVGRGDPYAQDGSADYGGDYTSGGNGFDESGGGCEWNFMPTDCRLLDFIGRTQQLAGQLNIRRQGQEGGGFALSVNLRIWRFDAYQPDNTEADDSPRDGIEQVTIEGPPYVGSVFAWHLSVGTIGFQQTRPQNPHNERKLTPRESGGIREILQKYLAGNKRCAEFMSSFLTELGKVAGVAPFSNDPLKIYDRLVEQDKLFSTDRPDGRAFASGSVGTGNAQLLFNFTKMMRSPQSFVAVTLHEVSHTAPGGGRVEYSHDQMDRAAFNVLEPEILSHPDLFGQTIMGVGRPEFMPGVSYFGKYIDKYCSLW